RKQELIDLCDEIEPGPDGAFSIILVRLRIAEIGKEPVSHESGDVPAHVSDRRSAGSLEGADHFAQVLGIERNAQSRRTDKIAKENRQLSSLGLRLRDGRVMGWG